MIDHLEIVDRLAAYPTEESWLEFRENRREPHTLGVYIR